MNIVCYFLSLAVGNNSIMKISTAVHLTSSSTLSQCSSKRRAPSASGYGTTIQHSAMFRFIKGFWILHNKRWYINIWKRRAKTKEERSFCGGRLFPFQWDSGSRQQNYFRLWGTMLGGWQKQWLILCHKSTLSKYKLLHQ